LASAGRAFALWIELSGALEGLYQANFASSAKRKANRHSPTASAERFIWLAADDCVIGAVYHSIDAGDSPYVMPVGLSGIIQKA
jgi:hypothetical protein